jgi:hypothetical protein
MTADEPMNMSRRPLALLAAASILSALAGCSSVHTTYAPDGRRGFAITCGGFLNDWSSCLVKAGRACGNRGYDLVKGNEEDRDMLIACKVPNSVVAAK